ncbi:hypothetical protein [Streptomyces sp. NPDC002588]|uniref:hypothetical protein n=1 Tax=Streptomyces sp. NPDC002588 TaxID=3154419 RepID=UPI0033216609
MNTTADDGVLRAVRVVGGQGDARERAAVTAALAALAALRASGASRLPSFTAPWVRDRAYLVPTAWTSDLAQAPRRAWVVEVGEERLTAVLAHPAPVPGSGSGRARETG